MGPEGKNDNKMVVYGVSAFVFLVGGVLLFANGVPVLISGASVFMGLIFIWLAMRSR